jgi:2,3-bisphosphoglycerate-independent phosphoglycerate mutase
MISLPFIGEKKPKDDIKPVVLLVLDGWGVAPASSGNAISLAKTPNMDDYLTLYPHGELIASGESVGLPTGEEGNSEVGHLTVGAGRVIYQSIVKINNAIKEATFADNKAFLKTLDHINRYKSKLHLMGLVGSGEVHSSIDHLYALLDFCQKNGLKNVKLHLFTDGRDASPKEGVETIKNIEEKLKGIETGQIATISGRYYAMDRDLRWERTQKAYEAMVLGKGAQAASGLDAVTNSYNKGQTDEFVEPTVIVQGAKPVGTVDNNDAVIFFNFRIDRPRQLTMAFVLPSFENLKDFRFGYDMERDESKPLSKKGEIVKGATFRREKWPQNLFFVTMTEYHKEIPVSSIAYPPETVAKPLPEVLSEYNLKQLCLAESEKERMVTFYFNGMRQVCYPQEEVVIIPSPKVATYDKKPEMSIYKIVNEFKKQIKKNKYHFYFINLANPDMVAHSGSMRESIKACEHTDKAVGELVEEILKYDGTVVISADHGNVEELLSYPTTSFFVTTSQGEINTEHSSNPVPMIVIGNRFKGNPINLPRGTLADVASTVLGLLNIPKPSVMTGKNLMK